MTQEILLINLPFASVKQTKHVVVMNDPDQILIQSPYGCQLTIFYKSVHKLC